MPLKPLNKIVGVFLNPLVSYCTSAHFLQRFGTFSQQTDLSVASEVSAAMRMRCLWVRSSRLVGRRTKRCFSRAPGFQGEESHKNPEQ